MREEAGVVMYVPEPAYHAARKSRTTTTMPAHSASFICAEVLMPRRLVQVKKAAKNR